MLNWDIKMYLSSKELEKLVGNMCSFCTKAGKSNKVKVMIVVRVGEGCILEKSIPCVSLPCDVTVHIVYQ